MRVFATNTTGEYTMLLEKEVVTFGPVLLRRSSIRGFRYDDKTQRLFAIVGMEKREINLGVVQQPWPFTNAVALRVEHFLFLPEHILAYSERDAASEEVTVWTDLGFFELPRINSTAFSIASLEENRRPTPGADWKPAFLASFND